MHHPNSAGLLPHEIVSLHRETWYFLPFQTGSSGSWSGKLNLLFFAVKEPALCLIFEPDCPDIPAAAAEDVKMLCPSTQDRIFQQNPYQILILIHTKIEIAFNCSRSCPRVEGVIYIFCQKHTSGRDSPPEPCQWIFQLNFNILSAVVGASLGPESPWADQDHPLQQHKKYFISILLTPFAQRSSFTCAASYSSTVRNLFLGNKWDLFLL